MEKKYKATEVKAGKNSFEANIATAYPEEAKSEKNGYAHTM